MADPHHPAGVAEPDGLFGWFKGRAGRREFWTHVAILFAVSFALSFLPPILNIRRNGVLALLQVSPTVVLMFLQIRRVHDLGRSGWWAVAATVAPIVLIVPVMTVASLDVASVTGVIFELLLLAGIGFLPGDPDENRFGSPPPYTLRRVLTGR